MNIILSVVAAVVLLFGAIFGGNTNFGISQVQTSDTINTLRTTVNELVTNYVASSSLATSSLPTSIVGSAYIGVSAPTGTVTLTNNGVRTVTAGSNITVTSATGTPTIAVTSTPSLTRVTYVDATTQTTNFKETGFNIFNATTTATATTTIQKQFFTAATIVQIDCSTNGANATIGADERASSTPDTLGTDVFTGGTLVCDSNGNTITTFTNATIAASAILNFDLDTLANSTTTVRVYIKYKE